MNFDTFAQTVSRQLTARKEAVLKRFVEKHLGMPIPEGLEELALLALNDMHKRVMIIDRAGREFVVLLDPFDTWRDKQQLPSLE